MAKEKIPFTSAPGFFVSEAGVEGELFHQNLSGEFVPTGFKGKVDLDKQLHGAPIRFESLSKADVEKALAKVKSYGFVADLGDTALVSDLGVPAVGAVTVEKFVVLGDRLVALAPQWVLLNNSVLEPWKRGQSFDDIAFTVSKIVPGRLNEALS